MSYITLTCLDCHQQFAWTEDEQEFYRQKNLPEPQYCLICRGKHQAQIRDVSQYQKK